MLNVIAVGKVSCRWCLGGCLVLEHDGGPEHRQIELNRVERWRSDLGVIAVRREDRPLAALEQKYFERPQNRVDEPRVSNAVLGVDGELFGLVDLRRLSQEPL